jgi:2-iminobutanoate/2-iminopropanoate deaminase
MKNIIYTADAPNPIGPYNQAVEYNGLVFISGQVAIDPNSGEFLSGDIREQTSQVLNNIDAILKEAGLDKSKVIKTTCLLSDMKEFKQMNEVYGAFFDRDEPARAAYQVARLPLNAKIEIEVIAGK